jgi:hypothetical protein
MPLAEARSIDVVRQRGHRLARRRPGHAFPVPEADHLHRRRLAVPAGRAGAALASD